MILQDKLEMGRLYLCWTCRFKHTEQDICMIMPYRIIYGDKRNKQLRRQPSSQMILLKEHLVNFESSELGPNQIIRNRMMMSKSAELSIVWFT